MEATSLRSTLPFLVLLFLFPLMGSLADGGPPAPSGVLAFLHADGVTVAWSPALVVPAADVAYEVYGRQATGVTYLGAVPADRMTFTAPTGFSTYGVAVSADGVLGEIAWADCLVMVDLSRFPPNVAICKVTPTLQVAT